MIALKRGVKLILASKSPRRKDLLQSLGVSFEIIESGIAEDLLPQETPRDAVRRLAVLKAFAVAEKHKAAWVLGADTVVVIDGKILGKPQDKNDAVEMLLQLQGRQHKVWGGLTLMCLAKKIQTTEAFETTVTMRPISKTAIEEYVSTGEPLDKAGAYAVQGIGSQFVDSVEGSYTNVVGLNLAAIAELFRKHDLLV